MKIPTACRPDLVASNDPRRAIINNLLLEIKEDRQARLVVTDGRMMLLLPVDVSADDVNAQIAILTSQLENRKC